jgi:DNA-binding beta-propeller fold protein YncE
MRIVPALLLPLALVVVADARSASAQAASPGYAIAGRLPVAGDLGWDYVAWDASGHRLFVSHGMKVDVIDPSGTSLGEIAPTPGVHGIALAQRSGRGFITDGRTDSITVFDLKTLAVVRTVASSGEGPDAILFEPTTNRVFAFNGEGMNATVLDAATGDLVGTARLGERPNLGSPTEGRRLREYRRQGRGSHHRREVTVGSTSCHRARNAPSRPGSPSTASAGVFSGVPQQGHGRNEGG